MLHQKKIAIQKYKNSTEKSEHHYLFKKDSELKGDNEDIFEYGIDFEICKIVQFKQ